MRKGINIRYYYLNIRSEKEKNSKSSFRYSSCLAWPYHCEVWREGATILINTCGSSDWNKDPVADALHLKKKKIKQNQRGTKP